MRLDFQLEVEVAAGAAVAAGLAFADDAHLVAIIYAGRDIDFPFDGAAFQPGSAASMAGVFNNFPASAAHRAGTHLNHGAQKGLMHLADFTLPLAGAARDRFFAGFHARASADGAFLVRVISISFSTPTQLLQSSGARARSSRRAAGARCANGARSRPCLKNNRNRTALPGYREVMLLKSGMPW